MSIRLALISGFFVLFCGQTAMAEGAVAQDAQWFVNLLNSHMGREFCPPSGTTFGAVAKAFSQYADSHGLHDKQLTDAEWLDALGKIYPCSQPKALTAEGAKELGAKPIGSTSGNYSVRPTGVYATIDAAASMALLDELRGPPSENLERKIHAIQLNGGDYLPPVLLEMAIAEYNAGKVDSAVFWLHAGLMRAILDVRLCTDPSVGDAPSSLMRRTPPALVKAAFSDDPKTMKIVQEVLAWDAKTPFHYDHRWIALHGAQATASALDPASAPTSVIVPEAEWAKIIAQNREAYPKLVESNVAHLKAAKS